MNSIAHLYASLRCTFAFFLIHVGARLLGFKLLCAYSPDADGAISVLHLAQNIAQLNSSVRVYVEDLDARYQ